MKTLSHEQAIGYVPMDKWLTTRLWPIELKKSFNEEGVYRMAYMCIVVNLP